MLKKAEKKLLVLFLILLVLSAILAALGNFYTEFLWFDHLGFSGSSRRSSGPRLASAPPSARWLWWCCWCTSR